METETIERKMDIAASKWICQFGNQLNQSNLTILNTILVIEWLYTRESDQSNISNSDII